jgi:glycerophosphoryl diester phosphodiesterase
MTNPVQFLALFIDRCKFTFRIAFYVQFFLLVSVVAVGQNADKLRAELLDASSKKVLVASHRATHNVYPENSLMAIKEAIRLGVDIIEIDVKVSNDGIPFLMHDRTMNRTTTGKGDPEEFTWAELSQLYIVDKGKQTKYRIPTLEEALTLAKGKILVDLDLKTDRMEKIIEVVNRTNTREIVCFFDSDYGTLSRVQKAGKEYMIMPRAYSVAQADSAITLFHPPVVHIDFSFYTPECIQLIRSHNARVWINALGDPDKDIRSGKSKEALKVLLANGANIIQTDEPKLLLKALKKGGYR